jgi:replicative DNA helicase
MNDLLDESFVNEPPNNIEAEQSVLGAVLWSEGGIKDVIEVLRPEDFYRPQHQMIFKAMMDLHDDHKPVDSITVLEELGKRGELIRAGGGTYLHDLLSGVATTANAGHHAKIVREKSAKPRVIESGTRLVTYGHGYEDAGESVARAQAEINGIDLGPRSEEYKIVGEILPGALDEIASYGKELGRGVPTGFKDLDDLIHGLHPGQLVIVGARPAIGKSTIGMDFARSAVKNGIPTAIFSLEMGRNEIVTRLVSAECRVSMHKIRAGMLSDEEWGRISRRLGDLNEYELWIDDSENLSISDIANKARRLKHEHGVRFLVVDYLQLMQGKRTEGRQQEVSDISRSLKILAKELGVPIVAMSQLNRGPEQRVDKRPQVSDLRESGSIEQDADLVILLHREDAYERESPRAGEADIIIGKHRNGPTGIVTVAFQGHYSRFVDMAN